MQYEEKKLKKPFVRRRITFSVLGFIIHNNWFKYTGVLFDYVRIKEQKIKYRTSYFDDGITYREYWGAWGYKWELIEIE